MNSYQNNCGIYPYQICLRKATCRKRYMLCYKCSKTIAEKEKISGANFMTRQIIPSFQSIAVFLEKRKTRQYVGNLTYLNDEKVFEFTYDEDYLYAKRIIP